MIQKSNQINKIYLIPDGGTHVRSSSSGNLLSLMSCDKSHLAILDFNLLSFSGDKIWFVSTNYITETVVWFMKGTKLGKSVLFWRTKIFLTEITTNNNDIMSSGIANAIYDFPFVVFDIGWMNVFM